MAIWRKFVLILQKYVESETKGISEIQVQLPVTKQIEGHSVVRGRSMFGDGGTMFFSGYPLSYSSHKTDILREDDSYNHLCRF